MSDDPGTRVRVKTRVRVRVKIGLRVRVWVKIRVGRNPVNWLATLTDTLPRASWHCHCVLLVSPHG